MTAQARNTGPNTRRKQLCRHAWCNHCRSQQWLRYDATNGTAVWVCETCAYVETDSDGELAPSPWVERET